MPSGGEAPESLFARAGESWREPRVDSCGAVQTILTAPPPWSPTVVAVAGQDVHVPAYLHTASDMRREGIPHVRKIAKSEAVSTLAGNTRK